MLLRTCVAAWRTYAAVESKLGLDPSRLNLENLCIAHRRLFMVALLFQLWSSVGPGKIFGRQGDAFCILPFEFDHFSS